MAVVRDIALLHGAVVDLDESAFGGASVTFRFGQAE